MATKEEIIYVMELLYKNRPKKIIDEMKNQEIGSIAVIKYLYKAEDKVKSIDISRFLEISSARMTIILKKLENKNLIEKIDSSSDGRAKYIQLTEKGFKFADKIKKDMQIVAGKIVDEFGLEEFEKTMNNLNKLDKILAENKPNMEDLND